MGMDAKLGSRPAREYLQRHQELLTFWEKYRYLPEGFTPEGNPRTTATSGFALSAALALNHAVNPSQDQRLYREMLSPHYHAAGYWFNDYNDYLHSVIWLHLYTLMP
jgi:hypothetical protein